MSREALETVRDGLRAAICVHHQDGPCMDRCECIPYFAGLGALERIFPGNQCAACFDHGDSSGSGRLVPVHERCVTVLEREHYWAVEARSYLKYETSPWALDLMRRYDEIASPSKEKESSDVSERLL